MKLLNIVMFSPPGLWTDRVFDHVLPPVAVLIVDDDTAGAQALATVLVIEGYRPTVVDGGQAAFKTPAASTPHVVVLDMEMPACDGYTVASAMRSSSQFANTPIIAYTSLPEEEVIARGKQARIDAFCRKGLSMRPLLDLIEHVAPV
ncbi:PAS/PAC sensor hybrid histidine kinase [Caballeronia catudaia]|uniref:PAS/PAC sensor hybrid histidine kinase n=1 Tax=Caballeronia catudaia TaxID=1777136 RepID=A0A158DKA2_9BURK|nr:response regulator [Caballeronia catudaia]SAK94840.1 PAS/PAC sensor hybrid histidine kinase [Caballeronia catudaia]